MASLRGFINSQNSDRIIARGTYGTVTCGALAEHVGAFDDSLAGRSVALKIESPLTFLQALVALHGVASNIVILSSSLPAGHTDEILAETGCDLLLTDALPAPSAAPTAAEEIATDLILTTSGTTGKPKLARQTLASLSRTTKPPRADAVPPRWGLLYDQSRFAGLQVILQALLGGGELVLTRASDDLSDRVETLASHGCTHLSATPSMWRKLLMLPASEGLDLQQVTLGGEIAEQNLLSALQARFPQARVSHVYASTELGVGFAVTDGRAGFPTAYLDEAPGDLALKVVDGLLWAKPSPSGPPVAAHIRRDDEGYYCTEDRVEQIDDRVHFRGRDSSVVNVGGTKLQIEHVESLLRNCELLSDCALEAIPNPILGSVLSLRAVPASSGGEAQDIKKGIKRWAREHLPREAIPAKIELVAELDLSAAGKKVRS